MSFGYVENIARAHLIAASKLAEDPGTSLLDSLLTIAHCAIERCFLSDGVIGGAAIFLTDFDANFCDTYKELVGSSPANVRIHWLLVLLLVSLVELVSRVVFWAFGIRVQHPVTGLTTETLVACSHLTAKQKFGTDTLGYMQGDGWITRAEAIRRTQEYWVGRKT